ncbi:lateral signaling target protein 2 homolog, partial [Hetaerina americana]|uniref:lateral signaling target protein 2 homolog n=1 Tax=Hetaerina americana TaxID=62018 RepID=UPI003A7F306D
MARPSAWLLGTVLAVSAWPLFLLPALDLPPAQHHQHHHHHHHHHHGQHPSPHQQQQQEHQQQPQQQQQQQHQQPPPHPPCPNCMGSHQQPQQQTHPAQPQKRSEPAGEEAGGDGTGGGAVDADNIRLEAIKHQILSKLGLKSKPNVTSPIPRSVVLETLYRAEETRGFMDPTRPPEPEDDFYGRTSEIITFAEP